MFSLETILETLQSQYLEAQRQLQPLQYSYIQAIQFLQIHNKGTSQMPQQLMQIEFMEQSVQILQYATKYLSGWIQYLAKCKEEQ